VTLIDTVRDKDRIKVAIDTVPHASNRALNRWIKFRARRARIPGAGLMALAGPRVVLQRYMQSYVRVLYPHFRKGRVGRMQ
jgi:hypothetical protein